MGEKELVGRGQEEAQRVKQRIRSPPTNSETCASH